MDIEKGQLKYAVCPTIQLILGNGRKKANNNWYDLEAWRFNLVLQQKRVKVGLRRIGGLGASINTEELDVTSEEFSETN